MIDRGLVDRLLELEFIERGENVLLKGASGVGKTMIAQNLGHTALAAGYSVRFSSLATALADLLGQESLPAFERPRWVRREKASAGRAAVHDSAPSAFTIV